MKRRATSVLIVFILAATLLITTTGIAQNNWWDKFGKPQYGGSITVRNARLNAGSWDTTAGMAGGGSMATNCWLEGINMFIWTLDRNIWAFPCGFTPIQHFQGHLVKKWEQTDPQTVTLHVREGVHWFNKPPVNGREFTAEDIQFNFDRALGTGSGFDKPHPFQASNFTSIDRVVATGKYTAEVRLKRPTMAGLFELLETMFSFVPPEWARDVDPTDWKAVIGTGAWIPVDFVEGSRLEMARNPDYWGYDDRYPENKLPYADTLIQLAVPDPATAMAALRTGKLDMWTDMMGALTWQQGETIKQSNPEIQQALLPRPAGVVMLRCDKEPFTDIRVRKALQLSVDRQAIISNYYQNSRYAVKTGWISSILEGWSVPYEKWPQSIKDEYAYNPEKAKQLLAEAGYPNGFKTNVVARSDWDMQLLQIFKSYFMDIGVDMEIRVFEPAAYGAFTGAGKQDQASYSDGMAGLNRPPNMVWASLLSSSIPRNNHTHNYDKTFDGIIEKMNSAPTLEEMAKMSCEADLYSLQQHWGITSVPSHTPVVWQPYIKGYSGEIMTDNKYAGPIRARVWVDQGLKKSMGR